MPGYSSSTSGSNSNTNNNLRQHEADFRILSEDLLYSCKNNNNQKANDVLNYKIQFISNVSLHLDYNKVDTDSGNNALIFACMNEMPVVELLLPICSTIRNPRIFDINLQNNSNMTALMIICMNNLTGNLIDIVSIRNLDLNLQDKDGNSALMIACDYENPRCVQYLLERRSADLNVNLKNSDGDSAIILACKQNSMESIRFLLLCFKF